MKCKECGVEMVKDEVKNGFSCYCPKCGSECMVPKKRKKHKSAVKESFSDVESPDI